MASARRPSRASHRPDRRHGGPCRISPSAHGFALVEDAAHAIGSQYKVERQARTRGELPLQPHGGVLVPSGEDDRHGRRRRHHHQRRRLAEPRWRSLRSHGMTRDPAAVSPNATWRLDAQGQIRTPGTTRWRSPATTTGPPTCSAPSASASCASSTATQSAGVNWSIAIVSNCSPCGRWSPAPQHHRLRAGLAPLRRRIDFATAGENDRATRHGSSFAPRIGTQVHYIPVHHQPYYRQRYGNIELPGANAYYARCLSLPLFPAMTDGDVDRVVAALATRSQHDSR